MKTFACSPVGGRHFQRCLLKFTSLKISDALIGKLNPIQQPVAGKSIRDPS
jgi:hypothetical protein